MKDTHYGSHNWILYTTEEEIPEGGLYEIHIVLACRIEGCPRIYKDNEIIRFIDKAFKWISDTAVFLHVHGIDYKEDDQ